MNITEEAHALIVAQVIEKWRGFCAEKDSRIMSLEKECETHIHSLEKALLKNINLEERLANYQDTAANNAELRKSISLQSEAIRKAVEGLTKIKNTKYMIVRDTLDGKDPRDQAEDTIASLRSVMEESK